MKRRLHYLERPPQRGRSWAYLGLALLGGLGCVESFDGSWVEIVFERPVGDSGAANRVPHQVALKAGSHFSLWAGLANQSDPTKTGLVKLQSFAIVPAVNLRSPCLIDKENGQLVMRDCMASGTLDYECDFWQRRAGLLADVSTSGWRVSVSASDGVGPTKTSTLSVPAIEPMGAPETVTLPVSRDEIALGTLVLTEGGQPLDNHCPLTGDDDRGYCLLPDGAIAVKKGMAVRTLEATYTAQIEAPPGDGTTPITPAARKAHCEAQFKANPRYYVGNVFQVTAPLNGLYYGINRVQDPNSSSFLGGTEFIVPQDLSKVRSMFLAVENRTLAEGEAAARRGEVPQNVYLAGDVYERARGITNLTLYRVGTGVKILGASVAVLSQLDEDEVQF